ncbi:MAG TPA: hypothetical protein VF760_11465 [Xanthobacteraceae bacterium]
MRPDRFAQLLLAAARSLPDTTAEPVAEDGKHLRPYLISVTSGGKTSRWQVVATSAPGDKYSEPEGEPVLGDKPEAPKPQPATVGTPAHLEAALVTAILEADNGEITSYDLYSRRKRVSDSGVETPDPPAIGHGATIWFRDGSKIYLNAA